MRRVIAEAEVGDAVLGDDPTVDRLEREAAELLGKEAALFFPSGTMANQAALHILARPGTEVLVQSGAHVVHYEEVAAAALVGVQLRALEPADAEGAESVHAACGSPSRYLPEVSLLCLENTHNRRGGTVLPVERMAAMAEAARSHHLPVHLDGARLPNAAVAANLPMSAWAQHADTVMLSLSKGLGAPIGSILAGTRAAMEVGWRVRRRLGGGMRQVGLLAAAGLYALRHNLQRLADDHRRAARLAAGIEAIEGLDVLPPETNIVMIDVAPDRGPAERLADTLREQGVLITAFGPQRLRAVTHLDVDDDAIDTAVRVIRDVASRSIG